MNIALIFFFRIQETNVKMMLSDFQRRLKQSSITKNDGKSKVVWIVTVFMRDVGFYIYFRTYAGTADNGKIDLLSGKIPAQYPNTSTFRFYSVREVESNLDLNNRHRKLSDEYMIQLVVSKRKIRGGCNSWSSLLREWKTLLMGMEQKVIHWMKVNT